MGKDKADKEPAMEAVAGVLGSRTPPLDALAGAVIERRDTLPCLLDAARCW